MLSNFALKLIYLKALTFNAMELPEKRLEAILINFGRLYIGPIRNQVVRQNHIYQGYLFIQIRFLKFYIFP